MDLDLSLGIPLIPPPSQSPRGPPGDRYVTMGMFMLVALILESFLITKVNASSSDLPQGAGLLVVGDGARGGCFVGF